MASPATRRPTDLELEILKTLWDQGPSTVRAVMEALSRRRRAGYTTVLKTLQIMRDKGLVVCDRSQRAHVYRPRHSRQRVVRRLAGDLLERVFEGSTRQLVLSALEHKKAKPEELDEIRRLLDEVEGRRK
ncbi:MAG: BlaI/MecI/CopY family transcriptional regulator [Armatimonadota bacterium]|nr:MAG: BlaI/MecI/CopY family transcriptional regulator [Armatimonadota bacterium]